MQYQYLLCAILVCPPLVMTRPVTLVESPPKIEGNNLKATEKEFNNLEHERSRKLSDSKEPGFDEGHISSEIEETEEAPKNIHSTALVEKSGSDEIKASLDSSHTTNSDSSNHIYGLPGKIIRAIYDRIAELQAQISYHLGSGLNPAYKKSVDPSAAAGNLQRSVDSRSSHVPSTPELHGEEFGTPIKIPSQVKKTLYPWERRILNKIVEFVNVRNAFLHSRDQNVGIPLSAVREDASHAKEEVSQSKPGDIYSSGTNGGGFGGFGGFSGFGSSSGGGGFDY